MMIYKEFDDYEKACQFYKTVKEGKIECSLDKSREYWIVWYDAVQYDEEPTREAVIEYFRHCIEFDNNFSMSIEVLEKAIEYIQQAPKYRKKAKRWKRKYMYLLSKVEKIRAEIAEDLANTTKEAKQTQDDVDCGKGIGLQMALNTIDKYREVR